MSTVVTRQEVFKGRDSKIRGAMARGTMDETREKGFLFYRASALPALLLPALF